jgi:ABC-type cobalt transport system, ATPase component
MPELVGIQRLCHRFHDGAIGLEDVDLRVDEGDFLIIAGRNGSGKSLLARHIIGLSEPSSGVIRFRGRPLGEDIARARRDIGFVFQDSDAQIVGQTLLEDAAFGPANLRIPRAESRARESLLKVGLSGLERRRPDSLSGGERRRLAIAGVLAMGPSCLIFDEPFANLDYPSIKSVLSIIVSLHAEGKSVIVITHELEKVLAHSTRLAIMSSGKIVFDGAPDGLGQDRFETLGLRNPFRCGARLEDLTWLR